VSDSARHQRVVRWRDGASITQERDELAAEEPLEIRVNNRAVSVTMRTPGHDDELAAGFLLTEDILHDRSDVLAIEPCAHASGQNVINVTLAPEAKIDLSRLTRHVFASSSCGLCGKATIDSIHQRFGPVATSDVRVSADVLSTLPQKLLAAQPTFERTGGLHGVGLFSVEGELIVAREDIGRHNAVDKVLGFAFLKNLLPLDRHILLVSGRASFEIMQKSLAGRIPIVAAVSAPSSLAADFATDSRQTLVGFLRDRRMNVYSEPERVEFPV
jgi:FdhD protein